ncbi:MAG: alpha-2-macroglobulin family protein, partial [Bacteroidota bacterium]
LKITTKNLAGEFEAATVEITVHQLKVPNTVFKKRYWNKPDVYALSENEFKKQFPNFAYQNEDEQANWRVDKAIYNESIDTRSRRAYALPVNNWEAGTYELRLTTKDKYGQAIEVKKYFDLYDLTSKNYSGNTALWLNHPSKTFEPSETAEICLATGLEEVQAMVEVEKKGKLVSRTWKTINGKEDLSFPVEESDRGNFHYHITFTNNNRTYKETRTINVPWSNKELNIEYATFRDKLKPGQEEEWRIKISGPKSEKVTAEMVAAMYDASLDQFAKNDWYFNVFPVDGYPKISWTTNGFSAQNTYIYARDWQPEFVRTTPKSYQSLNWFGFPFYGRPVAMARSGRQMRSRAMTKSATPIMMDAAPAPQEEVMEMAAVEEEVQFSDQESGGATENYGQEKDDSQATDFSDVKVRTNLNETVFFMPNLKTDEEGNVIIKFTMNEALTRWKFLGLAITKDLKTATTSKEIITQKELMVQPNAPRFFREGDRINFTAKVSNLTENELKGEATIQLFDALTMQPIDAKLGVENAVIPFTAKVGQSAPLSWTLQIPFGEVMAVTHRVIATAGNFSDGEESSLPVLTNRMLVTETKPLALRGKEAKTFTLESLHNMADSKTLTPHKYTLEFTSNPAWYAVQALPYLMEYPYDCTEQIFNRYYANTLASTVANAHPKIKNVFDSWKGTEAMKSNLSKNQELKSALLEETPWVLAAQSEEAQKKNIGLLFDLNRMADEQAIALAKINERQLSNGGFSWFPGGRDSWYITQNLVEGMGHLQKLNAMDVGPESATSQMLVKALDYMDNRLAENYDDLAERVKAGNAKFEDDHLSNIIIHYLYARSFFPTIEVNNKADKAYDYYVSQAEKHWLNKGVYQEGMIGLALYRMDKKLVPQDILKSLKERALQSEELGMYWKNPSGYYWYQLPIETHALAIELFEEVANDTELVNELKIWLLKNKQTNHWKTTKATSAVTYALLMSGDDWILEDQQVSVSLGKNKTIDRQIAEAQATPEGGTGYFKTSWNGKKVNSEMAKIKVKNPNKQTAWGAVYWQYFEDLDKVKIFKETPLTIDKQLFKEYASDQGPQIKPIAAGATLQPGDKLKVRIEIRVDRDMEYVHLKDMRASGFEPINVLSGYKYSGSLGYYESTGDAATNFFIGRLPKGTHVFEYPLRVVHEGDFSNGVTSLQCMYAPEFSSHSEGIRVTVNGEW